MNTLQALQMTAGQKIHERIYEAVFKWNDLELPCTHGEILRNPTLIGNGWSPSVLVTIGVRDEVFPAASRGSHMPRKGDFCLLETRTETLVLQIGEADSGAGEVVHKYVLWDRSQRA